MVDMERRSVLAAGAAIAAGLVTTSAGCSQTPRGEAKPNQGGATVKKADVPVGGGIVLSSSNFVVTQPEAGSFVAFVKLCPHAGCSVSTVDAKGILCNCHGSRFNARTGAVLNGPATSGLGKATVKEDGDNLLISG